MKQPRPFYFLLFLGCSALLGYGYYLQFVVGLEPCPLCIMQRLAYIIVIAVSLIGLIHAPKNILLRIYSSLIMFASLSGAGIAAWQVRLQHLPPEQVPECGPGLEYMLDVFPLMDVLKMAFTGSGECAEVDWTFLSLSIAEWSLFCFLSITLVSAIHLLKKRVVWIF